MSRFSLTVVLLLGITLVVAGICISKPSPVLATGAGSCDSRYGSLAKVPGDCPMDANPWCVTTASCVNLSVSIVCAGPPPYGGQCDLGKATIVVGKGSCVLGQTSGKPCYDCEQYICATGNAWSGTSVCLAEKCPISWTIPGKCAGEN